MCNPQIAVGALTAIVVLQGILSIVSISALQWCDCNIPIFEEFSFGLSVIRVDAKGGLTPSVDVPLKQLLDPASVVLSAAETFSGAIDATFGLLIAGMVIGVLAAVIGAVGVFAGAGKMHPVTALRISAGILALDGLLVLIAILVWWIGVMPNLKELGIGAFIGAFASQFSGSFAGGLVGAVSNCKDPYPKGGLIVSIIEVLMIFIGSVVCCLTVSPPDDKAREWEPSMRAEMMNFEHGKGGKPPMHGKGGKGGPGYGAPPPGYGGPPPGYGGPPPGYGGPPPPPSPRSHPFEGGPGGARMGPGYGAPPPQSSYGYNYGGKGKGY